MKNFKLVSVVMSVYNGASSLPSTLQSVLNQEGCDLEFIVINDGSSDGSGPLLDAWAKRDARLRVIHQANTGLTRALMRGCAEARGDFIARQDCGDVSLPGRLASQATLLQASPGLAMVASGARFLGPLGECLYEVIRSENTLHEGLSALAVNRIKGPPHHGGTMFRRSAYLEAGGYRAPFVVAQDIDLWLRLAERGRCWGQAEVFYEASLEPGSISNRWRSKQFQLATLAIDCAIERRADRSDEPLLEAFTVLPKPIVSPSQPGLLSEEKARFFYFVGCCLRASNRTAARQYFRQAATAKPRFLRAWVRSFLG